jgi:hypothetical protein
MRQSVPISDVSSFQGAICTGTAGVWDQMRCPYFTGCPHFAGLLFTGFTLVTCNYIFCHSYFHTILCHRYMCAVSVSHNVILFYFVVVRRH